MDKLSLLKVRRQQLLKSGSEVRKTISELVDDSSFVELDTYDYSKNEFYGEDAYGEGVVTGYATINDFPCYVVALNSQVLSGGLTYAGCKKIVKCLNKALNTSAPVIYLLSSKGIVAGEGVAALEGVAEVLYAMDELRGSVPQFAVSMGDVFGQASVFAAMADYNFFMKGACVAYGSPLVISAKSGKAEDKAAVGGAASASYNGIMSFEATDISEVKNKVSDILETLPDYGGTTLETMDDPNRSAPELKGSDAKALIKAVFDENYFIELNKDFAPEVVTGIGRVGGYSAAAIVFDGKDGVELDKKNIAKIKNFLYYCDENGLPVLTFVNTMGLKNDLETAKTDVLKDVAALVCALKTEVPRVNVVCGKAVGLGYTLFASKNFGADYSYAFADAMVAPFDSNVGAELEMVGKNGDYEEIKARYESEGMDAMNAARCGFVDDVIEPEFVRQYVVSALQMLY